MRQRAMFVTSLATLPVFLLLLGGVTRAEESIGCSVDTDCQSVVNGSTCASGNCTCPGPFPVVVTVDTLKYCFEGYNETGFNCTYDEQCDYFKGKCKKNTCGCESRFKVEENVCKPHEKSAVIPMAVGISIGVAVLGTLGLYLWLSRKKPAEPQYST